MSAVQIANLVVVQKIEWLASRMQLGKTAVVDRAIDALTAQWLLETQSQTPAYISAQHSLNALLTQMDAIADLPEEGGTHPLQWDAHGLPT
jgi:hypothetical protein